MDRPTDSDLQLHARNLKMSVALNTLFVYKDQQKILGWERDSY